MSGPKTLRWSVNAASSDVATYQELPVQYGEAPSGGHELGSQAVGFRVLSDTATSGATLVVVMAHPDGTAIGQGVCEVWTGTVTATTRRQNLANISGYYVCDVVFTKSGTNYVDVGGANDDPQPLERVKPYAGVSSLGSSGTLFIEAWCTRNAQ